MTDAHNAPDFTIHETFPASGFGSSPLVKAAIQTADENLEFWIEFPRELTEGELSALRRAASVQTSNGIVYSVRSRKADSGYKVYLQAKAGTFKPKRRSKAKTQIEEVEAVAV